MAWSREAAGGHSHLCVPPGRRRVTGNVAKVCGAKVVKVCWLKIETPPVANLAVQRRETSTLLSSVATTFKVRVPVLIMAPRCGCVQKCKSGVPRQAVGHT